MKTKLIAWYSNLSLRERCVFGLGGGFVIFLLVYSFFWHPLTQHVNTLRAKTLALQQQSHWIQQVAPRLHQGGVTREKVSNVMTTVEQSLARASLARYLQKVQQPQPDEVSITLKQVPFDQFITWLQQLVQHYQLHVFSVQTKPGKTFGTIEVQLLLKG